MRPAYVLGMHGLGDNLHERALVRHLLSQGREVWIQTPWPCLFHDLPVNCVDKGSPLRTQAKNAAREAGRFAVDEAPGDAETLRVWYPPDQVRRHGSVLAAMCASAGAPAGDFRLPVPSEWRAKGMAVLDKLRPTRPLLIVRPLVERREWSGCPARNPDAGAYTALFEAIRRDYFVISLADVEPGKEWIATALPADATFHAGELDIETIAALVDEAALVYASPGFIVPLAQSVETPVVCVFGGYENSSSFSGAQHGRYLGIDPIEPCACFSHHHACRKAIDIDAARKRLLAFVQ